MTAAIQAKKHTNYTWSDGTRRSWPQPAPASAFRNWPSMLAHWCQGNKAQGANITAGRQQFAKADICAMQGAWASEYSQEYTNITAIKAIRSGVIICPYMDPRFYTAGAPSNSDDATRWLYDVLNAGPTGWRLRDGSATALFYNGTTSPAANMAVHIAGLDGSGKRLSQAMADKLSTNYTTSFDRQAVYGGIALDDFNPVDAPSYSGGAATNADYEQNGVADDRYDDTPSTGGGAKYRTGMAQLLTDFRAKWPTWFMWTNTDFGYPYLQGDSTKPTHPITAIEWNQVADVILLENPFFYRARIGDPDAGGAGSRNDGVYPLGALAGTQEFWTKLAASTLVARTDAQSVLGRKCVVIYERAARAAGTSPTTNDYHMARLIKAVSMSMDGLAYGFNFNGADRPFWVDESAIDFGNPVGSRSMGTLNLNHPAAYSFTLRSPDFSSSGAAFYWTEFANALVVFRWDNTSITPGSSNLGDGTAVACTLPSAGTGFRWDEFNSSSYVHPVHTDLAMVSQDTAWNSGATNRTSVSLKPYQAKFFKRAPV